MNVYILIRDGKPAENTYNSIALLISDEHLPVDRTTIQRQLKRFGHYERGNTHIYRSRLVRSQRHGKRRKLPENLLKSLAEMIQERNTFDT